MHVSGRVPQDHMSTERREPREGAGAQAAAADAATKSPTHASYLRGTGLVALKVKAVDDAVQVAGHHAPPVGGGGGRQHGALGGKERGRLVGPEVANLHLRARRGGGEA
jgi:hypothetical protein